MFRQLDDRKREDGTYLLGADDVYTPAPKLYPSLISSTARDYAGNLDLRPLSVCKRDLEGGPQDAADRASR